MLDADVLKGKEISHMWKKADKREGDRKKVFFVEVLFFYLLTIKVS